MALILASANLSDDNFLSAFHSGELPASHFQHADHLRLAWLHIHRASIDRAEREVRNGIRKFAERHGASHLYHETITTAWAGVRREAGLSRLRRQ